MLGSNLGVVVGENLPAAFLSRTLHNLGRLVLSVQ
jgi:hypothetical protein